MRLHHQPRSRSTRVLWLLEELGDALRPHRHAPRGQADARVPRPAPARPLPGARDGRRPGLRVGRAHPPHRRPAPRRRPDRPARLVRARAPLPVVLLRDDRDRERPDGHRPPAVEGRRADRRRSSSAQRRASSTAAAVVEEALGDDDYLVGNEFSVADIVVGSVLAFARTGELTELPEGVVAVRRPARGAPGAAARRRGRPARRSGDARSCGSGPPRSRLMGRAPPRRLPAQRRPRCSAASPDMPVLLLTTTGRRTGRPTTTPLTYFELGDGDRGRRLERRRGQPALAGG